MSSSGRWQLLFIGSLLSACRSSSVSSEGTTSEREKTDAEEEEKEEDTLVGVAAPVEEPAAATPPAAREVPAHLRRQEVRKIMTPPHPKKRGKEARDGMKNLASLHFHTDPKGVRHRLGAL